MAPRIDSHQHFWTLARGDYDWLTPDLAPLYRDFGPEDLGPLMQAWGMEQVPYMVAADRRAATRIKSNVGGQEKGVVDYVAWLTLGEENFTREDFVSGRLDDARMPINWIVAVGGKAVNISFDRKIGSGLCRPTAVML